MVPMIHRVDTILIGPCLHDGMAKAPPKRSRTKLLEVSAGDALRGPETGPSRQAPLFRDPMPDRVEPCLATLAPKVPVAPHWAYEIKWDGYRLHVHVRRSRRHPRRA